MRRGSGVVTSSTARKMARAGGGHHGPPMPPFARLKPPDYPVSVGVFVALYLHFVGIGLFLFLG